jgi:hypothetical protein
MMLRHITPAAVARASTQLQAQTKAANATQDASRPALDLAAMEAAARVSLQVHINASARGHSAEIARSFRQLHADWQRRQTLLGIVCARAYRITNLGPPLLRTTP